MEHEFELIGNLFENIELLEIDIVEGVHPIGFNAEHQTTVQDVRDECTLENQKKKTVMWNARWTRENYFRVRGGYICVE